MQRKPLVVGNWKMNASRLSASQLLAAIADGAKNEQADLAVCVPYPYLQMSAEALQGSKIALGAQALNAHDSGAHTGEVSGAMLVDFGCVFVLVGHSERRVGHGEDDKAVAAKTAAALRVGLRPIICIGESLLEREAGVTKKVVLSQLAAATEALSDEDLQRCVIAYEPVWAIGTGLTANPSQVAEVHADIRAALATRSQSIATEVRILYGGSVKPAGAAELFALPDVDGGLIGGASLVAADFLAIAAAAAAASTSPKEFSHG